MEKQWLKNLRERFTDRKVAPPEGLWKDIQKSLAERKVISEGFEQNHKPFVVLLRRASAVAACFLCLLGIGYVVFKYNGQTSYVADKGSDIVRSSLAPTFTPVENDVKFSVARVDGRILSESARNYGITNVRTISDNGDSVVSIESIDGEIRNVEPNKEQATDTEKNKERESSGSVVIKQKTDETKESEYLRHSDKLLSYSSNTYYNKGISVSVFGSGMTSFGSSSGISGTALMASNLYQGDFSNTNVTNNNNDIMLLSTAYVKDVAPSEIKIKHRFPLRAGMAVRFKLNERWGLNTGLNYSFHFSTISSDEKYKSYTTDQKLHFVGVPVSVSYDILRIGNIGFYVSAGGAVELCVSGKANTDYILPDDKILSVDEDVRDRRPQWSVNSSVGVQYKLSDLIGLYIEPGVGYYFNNGSSISTIYKEKPLNFNVSVGVRFMLK